MFEAKTNREICIRKATGFFYRPENITYFRANGLDDELRRDPRVTWLVTFYAAWSPSAVNFQPVFSKISADYGLPNLKFGKMDAGRYPDVAEKHHVSTSALTRQLPTVIMFQVSICRMFIDYYSRDYKKNHIFS